MSPSCGFAYDGVNCNFADFIIMVVSSFIDTELPVPILKKPYLKKRTSACGMFGNKDMLYLETDLSIIKNKYNFAKRGKTVVDKIISQFSTKNFNKDIDLTKIKKSIKKQLRNYNKLF